MFSLTRAAATGASPVWRAELEDHVIASAWSPDGRFLAVAALGGPVAIYSGASGERVATIPGHNTGTTAVTWRFDGGLVATGGQDGTIRLWNPLTGELVRVLEAGASWVEAVAFAPGQDWLLSAAGRVLRLWNSAGELLTQYAPHPSTIADIAWQKGDPFFATAAYGQLAMFRAPSAEPYKRFEWKGSILRVAWSPNGNYIATGNQDASVHFWYRKTGADLEMSGYHGKVRELAWDSTSRYLATGGSPVVTVWDCGGKGPAGTRPIQLDGHGALPSALAYQHGGPLLVSGCRQGRVFLWHPAKSGASLFSARLEGEITQLHWAPDDRSFAAASSEGHVTVFTIR